MGLKRSRVERDKASPVLYEVCRKRPAPSNATPGAKSSTLRITTHFGKRDKHHDRMTRYHDFGLYAIVWFIVLLNLTFNCVPRR